MTATLNPALSSALDALSIAESQVQDALTSVEGAKVALNESARLYLMESPEAELLERSAYVYWNLPSVPVGAIASVVLGNASATAKLIPMLPKKSTDVTCPGCGSSIQVTSRSALYDLQREIRKGHYLPACKPCKEAEQTQRSAAWAHERRLEIERIDALRTMPYRDYLLTEEWLETRNQKLRQARFKCQLCNTGGLLNVHHRTYERRGCEQMADLIVLCHPCHAKFHGKTP